MSINQNWATQGFLGPIEGRIGPVRLVNPMVFRPKRAISADPNGTRTTVKGMGQVETDEIYVGVDDWGNHYVMPVQAKGGKDKLGVVQIEQDIALCRQKLKDLTCRPVAAQFMAGGVIALFEFAEVDGEVQMAREMHYRLVMPDQLTPEDLETYRKLSQPSAPPS